MESRADEAPGRDLTSADPYRTLGVNPDVSDADLRSAYRRLALLHHPDHNGGSPEAARRFAAVQAAYDTATGLRRRRPPSVAAESHQPTRAKAPVGPDPLDPGLQSRIAAVECDYEAGLGSQQRGRSPHRSPYAPGSPRDSLRDRLTEWFRET